MVKQIDYIKSNLIYPDCKEIEDTYTVVIKRPSTNDREESLNESLKEFGNEDTRGL